MHNKILKQINFLQQLGITNVPVPLAINLIDSLWCLWVKNITPDRPWIPAKSKEWLTLVIAEIGLQIRIFTPDSDIPQPVSTSSRK